MAFYYSGALLICVQVMWRHFCWLTGKVLPVPVTTSKVLLGCSITLTVMERVCGNLHEYKVIRGQSQKRMARWPKTNNGDGELYWKSTALNVVLREACVL